MPEGRVVHLGKTPLTNLVAGRVVRVQKQSAILFIVLQYMQTDGDPVTSKEGHERVGGTRTALRGNTREVVSSGSQLEPVYRQHGCRGPRHDGTGSVLVKAVATVDDGLVEAGEERTVGTGDRLRADALGRGAPSTSTSKVGSVGAADPDVSS
jgi:hypothetical protein